jgi:hypothetical protein
MAKLERAARRAWRLRHRSRVSRPVATAAYGSTATATAACGSSTAAAAAYGGPSASA